MSSKQNQIQVITAPVVVRVAQYHEENQDIGIVSNPDGQAFFHVADGRQIVPSHVYPQFLDEIVAAPSVGATLVVEIQYRKSGPFGAGRYVTRWGMYQQYVDAKQVTETRKRGKPAPKIPAANDRRVFVPQKKGGAQNTPRIAPVISFETGDTQLGEAMEDQVQMGG